MVYSYLNRAIAEARVSRYYSFCKESNRRALRLYRANIKLSKEIFGVLGILEVVLRNSIDCHFKAIKGQAWLEDAVEPGGYLNVSQGCGKSNFVVREALNNLGVLYSHDQLIARLSFGFWRYQFAKNEFTAAGSTLLEIFPKRPYGVNQKIVFQLLTKINDMRNRIAHHEPICFVDEIISTSKTRKRYHLMLEIINWLGFDHRKLLYGIDRVQKTMDEISQI